MNTYQLVTDLVINYLQSEDIYVDYEEIEAAVVKWMQKLIHFNIDFITLAAIVIADPDEDRLTLSEARKIREFYFPLDFSYKG